jgi:hypothetical protein
MQVIWEAPLFSRYSAANLVSRRRIVTPSRDRGTRRRCRAYSTQNLASIAMRSFVRMFGLPLFWMAHDWRWSERINRDAAV